MVGVGWVVPPKAGSTMTRGKRTGKGRASGTSPGPIARRRKPEGKGLSACPVRLESMAPVRAVCADCANGRKALPYGMRFSCFTNRDLRRR